ncbi:MAG: alpha/beta fold hydrolase [Actinobacteria bacterium]|nr:MAG: alpha/beta fold hydrolase [Actinomycetota bacterium]
MPFARNGAVEIAYRAVGPSGGEPVLLIMGLGGSGRMWWRLEPHVAGEHRALLIDNRGTGDSDRIRGPISMADLAADAVAVLDAAGVERAHVVGVSMGGMVAQHIGLDHRQRVRSLVLACTTAGGRSGPPPWRLLLSTALRPVVGPGRTWGLVAPILYAPATLRDQRARLREDLDRRIADATPSATLYAQMGAIRGHDVRARLSELEGIPTLVLHGAADALVPPAAGRYLAERIPGARLRLIPGAGHVMTTDAEEEVAGAILEHLRAATAGAAPVG